MVELKEKTKVKPKQKRKNKKASGTGGAAESAAGDQGVTGAGVSSEEEDDEVSSVNSSVASPGNRVENSAVTEPLNKKLTLF